MAKKDFLQIDVKNKLKFDEYFKKRGKEDPIVREKMALTLLNWVVNGSPNSNRVPPILYGTLYGSGSCFVGGKFISTTPGHSEAEYKANRSLSEKDGVITVGFNAPYARRWHEEQFNPGPVSSKTPGVGWKYIEEHLKADGPDLLKFYSQEMAKI